jgi:hypothetical protein
VEQALLAGEELQDDPGGQGVSAESGCGRKRRSRAREASAREGGRWRAARARRRRWRAARAKRAREKEVVGAPRARERGRWRAARAKRARAKEVVCTPARSLFPFAPLSAVVAAATSSLKTRFAPATPRRDPLQPRRNKDRDAARRTIRATAAASNSNSNSRCSSHPHPCAATTTTS